MAPGSTAIPGQCMEWMEQAPCPPPSTQNPLKAGCSLLESMSGVKLTLNLSQKGAKLVTASEQLYPGPGAQCREKPACSPSMGVSRCKKEAGSCKMRLMWSNDLCPGLEARAVTAGGLACEEEKDYSSQPQDAAHSQPAPRQPGSWGATRGRLSSAWRQSTSDWLVHSAQSQEVFCSPETTAPLCWG